MKNLSEIKSLIMRHVITKNLIELLSNYLIETNSVHTSSKHRIQVAILYVTKCANIILSIRSFFIKFIFEIRGKFYSKAQSSCL